jgi:hypothetical protein
VFAYLTDVTNLPQWQKTAITARADGELGVGARIHERREFQGRTAETELEVTGYDSPSRFDLKSLRGPVSYEIRHTLEPAAVGTRLYVEVDFKFGPLMRVAAKAFIRPAEREFERDFERLKQILESGRS